MMKCLVDHYKIDFNISNSNWLTIIFEEKVTYVFTLLESRNNRVYPQRDKPQLLL